jgi:hypothetical protein
VAGKGSHKRAVQPPRPQPQPPVFQEIHFGTEVRALRKVELNMVQRSIVDDCVTMCCGQHLSEIGEYCNLPGARVGVGCI